MENWLIAIISLAGSTIITTVIGLIVKRVLNRKFNEEKELAELRAEKERQANAEVVRSTVKESVEPIREKVDFISDKVDTIARGTQAVLRDRLIQLYNYCTFQGYASLEQKQNFENMYTKYHSLGQNGVMDSCYEKMMEMPDKAVSEDK